MKTLYIVKLENGMIVPMINERDMAYSSEKNCLVCNFNNELKGMKFDILMTQKIRKSDNFNDFWLMFRAGLEEGKRQANMIHEKDVLEKDESGLVASLISSNGSSKSDLAVRISDATGRKDHPGSYKSAKDSKNSEMTFWR